MGGIKRPRIIRDDVNCSQLAFEAHLQSLNTVVTQGLLPDVELEIYLEGKKLVAKTKQGIIAGSIIENLASLKKCVELGYHFQAKVMLNSGGNVKVLIHPRNTTSEPSW